MAGPTTRAIAGLLGLCLVAAGAGAQSPVRSGASKADTAHLEIVPTDVLPKAWGATYAGTMRSAALGEIRKISLYVPATFTTTKRRYPVLFLSDGEYDFERAAIAARELARSGYIPECIVAAIETPERTQDLTPPGMSTTLAEGEEKGEKFLQFIVNELRPELESKLRATRPSVFVGHSHGGILAHYAAAKWRQEIPFILALDAPMHLEDGWLVKTLNQSMASGGRLRLVSIECKYGWIDKDWDELEKHAPKDWKLTRRKLENEAHETMVFSGFYLGLKDLFADYSFVNYKNLTGPEAFARYEALTAEYGAPVTAPENVLRRAVMELTVTGSGAAAHRALQSLVDGYGAPPDRTELEQNIDEAAAAMKGKESIEQLLATKPSAAEMQPYLGVWKGVNGMAGEPGTPVQLTLSVKDGRGAGEFVFHHGPAGDQVAPLTYLRVTQDGLEFGFLNGMFPPGVLAHVARLNNGRLEGDVVFKGIYFKRPAGEPPMPHIVFSLERTAGP